MLPVQASMRIVLCYPLEARHLKQVQACAPHAEVVDAGQERVATEILDADVFCGHAKLHPVPWDEVVARGRLKWIQSAAAGLDHCLVPSVVESSIVVTSASGVLADQVGEHALALLLALLRSLPVFWRAQERKEFVRRPTRDLHHSTVGIVGFGGNGRRLAELLAPFKVRIVATDWFPINKPAHVDLLLPPDRLEELLPQVNILILTAPLTEHTRGMINARTLHLLPRGAVVINVARGGLVVERDLVEAIASGHLAGAGLDVTEVEPLPPDSPLWSLPQVIITPHVGGQSARRADDMTRLFCENLKRWLSGSRLLNLVDKRLGFPVPEGAV